MKNLIITLAFLFYTFSFSFAQESIMKRDSIFINIDGVDFQTSQYNKNIITPIVASNPFKEIKFIELEELDSLQYNESISFESFISFSEFIYPKSSVTNLNELYKKTAHKNLFFISKKNNRITRIKVYVSIN
ncbi:MAG: hypothetical protein HWD84_05200 [Flavobacteriaceae bacterium]|nr:hypothetical protein [Flavobacteriaceae bacterium]